MSKLMAPVRSERFQLVRGVVAIQFFVVTLLLGTSALAQQIAPNPNPAGNTIVIADAQKNSKSYENRGTIQVDATGFLDNQYSIVNWGDILNSGAILDNEYGRIENWGHINNLGSIEIATRWDMLDGVKNSGTIDNSGTITNSQRIQNYATLNNSGTINNSRMISNYGTITNTSYIANSGELWNGWGPTYLINSGTIDNTKTLTNEGTLNNTGTINNSQDFMNSEIIANSGVINNTGRLWNGDVVENTGTVANSDVILNTGSFRNRGTIDNHGTIENRTGGHIENYDTLENHGIVENGEGGRITNYGSFENTLGTFVNAGGTFKGTGRFVGTLDTGTGIVAPGTSVGTMVVDGDYILADGGTLEIEIGGFESGESDFLDITGQASLAGGTIDLHISWPYAMEIGSDILPGQSASIMFLEADAGITAFASAINCESLRTPFDDGFTYDVFQQGNTLWFRAINTNGPGGNTVPAPGGILLCFAGSALTVHLRRRRAI